MRKKINEKKLQKQYKKQLIKHIKDCDLKDKYLMLKLLKGVVDYNRQYICNFDDYILQSQKLLEFTYIIILINEYFDSNYDKKIVSHLFKYFASHYDKW